MQLSGYSLHCLGKTDLGFSEPDNGLATFVPVRSRLFGIAYRMLGSAAEAEDILQDVWLRWQCANRLIVENPSAYLATTTTRLCINLAQSAHARHEVCTDTCFPEPVSTDSDPRLGVERSEALKHAVVVLLERLSPAERTAYVLREAFDYCYCQLGDILQMEEANVRQLVSRARKHLAAGRRTRVGLEERRRFLDAFVAAAQNGDMAALEDVLMEDVVLYSKNVRGARPVKVPVADRDRTVTFVAAVA